MLGKVKELFDRTKRWEKIIMCCCRIDTDVLMANLFAESADNDVRYTMENMGDYLNFLSQKIPIYLSTNFSEETVFKCAQRFPKLYKFSKDENGTIIVESGNSRPNLEYFNASYSANVSDYIKKITRVYIDDSSR